MHTNQRTFSEITTNKSNIDKPLSTLTKNSKSKLNNLNNSAIIFYTWFYAMKICFSFLTVSKITALLTGTGKLSVYFKQPHKLFSTCCLGSQSFSFRRLVKVCWTCDAPAIRIKSTYNNQNYVY